MTATARCSGFLKKITIIVAILASAVPFAQSHARANDEVKISKADALPLILHAESGPAQQLLLVEVKAKPDVAKDLRIAVNIYDQQL